MARGAFWTIIVDNQPTAFRAAVREDLLPTLKQLQRQHPSAVIRWFQRGRLWDTPGEAMDASKPPRRGPSWRPGGAHKDPRDQYKVPRDVKRKRWAAQAAEGRGPWVRGQDSPGRPDNGAPASRPPRKPFAPRERDGSAERPRPPHRDDRPRATGERPAWKPAQDRRDADRARPDRRAGAGARPESGHSRPRKPFQARPAGGGKPGEARPTDRRTSGKRPFGDKSGWRPTADGAKGAAPRQDWRGERRDRGDASAKSAGAPGAPAKKGRTWKVGQVPPPDRKRRKDED